MLVVGERLSRLGVFDERFLEGVVAFGPPVEVEGADAQDRVGVPSDRFRYVLVFPQVCSMRPLP